MAKLIVDPLAVVAQPGYVTGLYYTVPLGSSVNTQILTENRLYFWPFYVSATKAFDRIAVDITTGAGDASTQIRWGIYTAVNGRPSARVLDAGVTTIGVGTGNLNVTIAQTLAPGWYFLAVICNRNAGVGALPTLRSAANEARFFGNFLLGLAAPTDVQNSNVLFNDETVGTWGSYVLPATATSGLGAAGSLPPIIFARAA